MLTASQKALIKALPVEGALYYADGSATNSYSAQTAAKWSLAPIAGKIAVPPTSPKRAIILHGAPGVGKSYTGIQYVESTYADELDHLGIISYDEAGAIYDIPEYVERLQAIIQGAASQHTPTSPDTFLARHQLWLDFQPLSQYVRALTLKEALRRELSVFIDTTSSGPGTFRLIETLRALDYTNIEVVSVHAGLEQGANRVIDRLRPTSAHDLLVKRVGAYETLPELCSVANRLIMLYNPNNQSAPTQIARFDAGTLTAIDPKVLNALTNQLFADVGLFKEATAHYLPQETGLVNRYKTAVTSFRARMELLCIPEEQLQSRPSDHLGLRRAP